MALHQKLKQRSGTARYAIIFVLVAVALLVLMRACADDPEVVERKDPVLAVKAVAASVGPQRTVLALIGSVEARGHVMITSPIETEVLDAPLLEGDAVKAGERLVVLDLREIEYQLRARSADKVDIEAQIEGLERQRKIEGQLLADQRRLVELAESQLDRSRRLYDNKAVTKASFEQTEGEFKQRNLALLGQEQKLADVETRQLRLQASLERTAAELDQLRLTLERARAVSPFDGLVSAVHVSSGSRVTRGAPLAEFFDPATFRLRSSIPSAYLAAMTADALEGVVATPSGPVTVALSNLAPETVQGSSGAAAFFALPEGEWRLGATHELSLQLPPVDGTVVLPSDALYRGGSIYRADAAGRAEALSCTLLGAADATGNRLVLRCPDLVDGDTVVVTQAPQLVSGMLLNIAE